jgi:predicted GNAT family acetyltransferase
MSQQESGPDVVDDTEHQRFVAEVEGALARLDYQVGEGRLVLVHTEVPEQLGGRGLGGRLVQAGVARAARDGVALVPWCPYARKWLRDHPDAAASVEIDWSERPANR